MSCKEKFTKKYRSRPGPPFGAQDCKYLLKYGNDGKLYDSTPNKNKVFAWKKSKAKKTVKKTNKKTRSRVKKCTCK